MVAAGPRLTTIGIVAAGEDHRAMTAVATRTRAAVDGTGAVWIVRSALVSARCAGSARRCETIVAGTGHRVGAEHRQEERAGVDQGVAAYGATKRRCVAGPMAAIHAGAQWQVA